MSPISWDHYRIEALLGAGGMGEVYRAEDLRLGRPVALKFLSSELAGEPEWRERLAREARAASTLSSPFVAATYELAEHGGRQFIAMEYVEGELLSERLAKNPLSLDRAVRLGLQVGEALEEAHERGVIHRDIKPGNLMLTRHSRVKVLDFGLAKLDPSLLRPSDHEARTLTLSETQPGMLLGTVSYMSPEQALGRAVDKRKRSVLAGRRALPVDQWRAALSGRDPDRGDHGDRSRSTAPAAGDAGRTAG